MARLVCALIAALLTSAEAAAGAWPREDGGWFVSTSHSLAWDRNGARSTWTGLYVEHGLTPRLTFGIDAGQGLGAGNWQALAFLRYDLAPDGPLRIAVALGAGGRGVAGGAEPLLRPELALGRGFDSRWGPGWIGLDAQALYAPDSGWSAWKADLTAGIRPRPDRALILQLQTSGYPDAAVQVRIAPSAVLRLGRRLELELGVTAETAPPYASGVKIGTWLTF